MDEKFFEQSWLDGVRSHHRDSLSLIDVFLNSMPVTNSVSRHSRSVRSVRSVSSSQAGVLEAERLASEAQLKLKQVTEENERRAKEDITMQQKILESQA